MNIWKNIGKINSKQSIQNICHITVMTRRIAGDILLSRSIIFRSNNTSPQQITMPWQTSFLKRCV